MFGSVGQAAVKNLGNGGTIDGDLSITGAIEVTGNSTLTLNTVQQGTYTLDINSTEALLVRKDGDGGDIFSVDTTNSKVVATELDISGNIDVDGTSNLDDVDIDGDVDISGSITNATWTGDVIASAYLDSDTAHLSGTQTFSGSKTFSATTIISSTNQLQFGDDGTYIHQSADGTLDLVADTILELNGGAGSMKIDANSKISLSNNDSGTNNTIFGKGAGASIVSGGQDNVLIGPESGASITIGDDNIAVGNGALGAETVGQSSVAIGTAAAGNQAKSGGSQGHMRNTAIGTTSLYYNVTGTQNTFCGADAGVGVSGNSHSNNTGLGYYALGGITTADYSVAIGSNAGTGITAHDYNIAIGKDSLRVCNDGYNVAIGAFSLEDGTNTYSNIAIGGYALNKHAGANTVAVGESALQKNTTGVKNTAIGYQTLVENTVADNNTAVGFQALKLSNKTGSEPVLSDNTAVGAVSSSQVTTGVQNTSLGAYALAQTVDSDSNTALGYYACGAGDIANNGITAVGAYSLAENVAGQKNTALGFQSGNVLTSGSQNTIVGYDADTDDNAATNQTVIGSEVTGVADNSVTLGNASVTAVYAASDSGAIVHCAGLGDGTDTLIALDTSNNVKINGAGVQDTGNPGWTFVAGNSNQGSILEHACGDAGELIATFRTTSGVAGGITTSGTSTTFATSSDYRLKENEVAISDGLTRINQLKPYRFNWKHDKDTTVDGFFAHEVSEIVPEAIVGSKDAVNDNGEIDPQGIDQSKLVPLLVKAVQELSAKVTELENK